MNKIFCLLAALLFLATGCGKNPSQSVGASLKYDGVYRSGAKNNGLYLNNAKNGGSTPSWHYLRFYPDGDVIAVSSIGQPEDLRNWFNKENPKLSHGKATIQGNRISFSTVLDQETVDYTGVIDGGQIRLDSYSHINQHRETDVVVFVKW